jgi:hypothetical protein
MAEPSPAMTNPKEFRVKSAYSNNGHTLSVIALGFPTLRPNDRPPTAAVLPS